MIKRISTIFLMALVIALAAFAPGSEAQRNRDREAERGRERDIERYSDEDDCQRQFNQSFHGHNARAMDEEKVTLSRAEVQALAVEGSRNGGVSIRGWDNQEIVVRACKIAYGDTEEEAQAILKQLTITTAGGKVSARGPEKEMAGRGGWFVQFRISVPRDLSVEARVHNGGVALRGLTGKVEARSQNGGVAISDSGGPESMIDLFAQNGGIALNDVQGRVNAKTANGGISLRGGSGMVALNSQNGGMVIKLPEGGWQGERLEARSENGGLILQVPSGFSSGIEAETSSYAPLDCKLPECGEVVQASARGPKRIQIGGAPVVSVSTRNGNLQIVPAK
jgi:hypothetical protein